MKDASLILSIALISLTAVKCEFFSSTHELTKLAAYEELLLEKMEKFVLLNQKKLDYIKEKLAEFETAHEEAMVAGQDFIESPINKYLLMKRLTLDWEKLENFLTFNPGNGVLTNIDNLRATNVSPGIEDFDGAMEGILRLQKIYRLSSKDMAGGILRGVNYSTQFTSKDCYDIGKKAMLMEEYSIGHGWLLESLERHDSYSPTIVDTKLEKSEILESLAEAKYRLGDNVGAAELMYSLAIDHPNTSRYMTLYNFYAQQTQVSQTYVSPNEHPMLPENLTIDPIRIYDYTCNGILRKTPSEERNLKCRYVSHHHPFLRIAPFKAEDLNLDPPIIMFYDVIYDSEIAKVIELANGKIQRAMVMNFNGSEVSKERTSQFAFFPRETDVVLQTIDQRVSDMTGLSMETAEEHQVANYGIGGHYSQHCDFFYKVHTGIHNLHLGNRIATLLFYLSDVKQGGGTAFPLLKTLLKPVKGAAAFWFNLHRTGDGDNRTKHGGCPTLVGSKWVLNRWLRERGQEFIRPCDLVSDAEPTAEKFYS